MLSKAASSVPSSCAAVKASTTATSKASAVAGFPTRPGARAETKASEARNSTVTVAAVSDSRRPSSPLPPLRPRSEPEAPVAASRRPLAKSALAIMESSMNGSVAIRAGAMFASVSTATSCTDTCRLTKKRAVSLVVGTGVGKDVGT